ncbi:MAG: ATP-binding protein, partial [Candidatus Binatia bacterium]
QRLGHSFSGTPSWAYPRRIGYIYAALTVAVTAAVRLLVAEAADVFSPFLLFSVPVLFSAWFFGRGGGLVATVLSALTIRYAFLSPRWSLYIHPLDYLALVLFIAEGVVISLFAAAKRELENKLEQRADERTQELRESVALAALGTTTAKISQEIATPLAALLASMQALEQRLQPQKLPDASNHSLFEEAKSQIGRLQTLVSQIGEFAGPPTLNLTLVNLEAVVREVSNAFSGDNNGPPIAIEQHVPKDLLPVVADEHRLKQALSNLWKNAVESMPRGGKIILRAYTAANDLCLEIQDAGAGVPADMNIFDLFTTSKKDGWGLGLPIARQIILAHKGRLEYVSIAGQGTIVKVYLPIARSAAAPR